MPIAGPSRRQLLSALAAGSSVALTGCLSRSPGVPGPVPSGTTDGLPGTPVRVSAAGATVAPGEIAGLDIVVDNVRSLSFTGTVPAGLGGLSTLGSPWFDPPADIVLESLPPIYRWEPYAAHVEGTYPIHVSETASPGSSVLAFRVDCDHDGYCDGSAMASATLRVTR